ncbi:hypothetical protein A4G18_08620 [Pasteurellaceae bacterium Pebbles2]|nr:hypothetical protein [Pasteurellaceae bacterium Pebbles2]
MNKKINVLLKFSALALAVGVGTQFYTNYQIDQSLAQFPYQLKDQFIINVSESNRDFITRDLTFSLEQNGQKTDFLHTKLTALPLLISAESEINPALIKRLNEQLNITIDKNTITSQFSVFSDGLSSRLQTEFRDSTNKAQTLESQLSYSNDNKSLALQTQLSGFNYDKLLEIKDLTGDFLLLPMGDSLYDISRADVKTKKIDINFLDGDNSHLGLVKGHYVIDKKPSNQGYDLSQRFENEGIYFSNNKTKSDEDKIRATNVSWVIQQMGVPSHVTFFEQMKQLQPTANTPLDVEKLVQLVSDYLFNNQHFKSEIQAESVIIPQNEKAILEAKNAQFNVQLNHQDRHNANEKFTFSAQSLQANATDETAKLGLQNDMKINGLSAESEFSQFNLEQSLAFLHKYLPKALQKNQETSEKSTALFLNDLQHLAENAQTRFKTAVKIKQVSLKDIGTGENLELNYSELPSADNLAIQNIFSAEKLTIPAQQMQLNQAKLTLPLNLPLNPKLAQSLQCQQFLYKFVCANNVPAEKYFELMAQRYLYSDLAINQAQFNAELNTYPKEQTALPVRIDLNLKMPHNSAEKSNGFGIFEQIPEHFAQANIQLNAVVPSALLKEEKPTTEIWIALKEILMNYFTENNEQYQLNFEANQGEFKSNGTPIEIDEE